MCIANPKNMKQTKLIACRGWFQFLLCGRNFLEAQNTQFDLSLCTSEQQLGIKNKRRNKGIEKNAGLSYSFFLFSYYSAPNGGFSWNLIFEYFFENMSGKIQVSLKFDILTTTVPEDPCIFMIIYRSVLRRVRNFSNFHRENQNTFYVPYSSLHPPKIVPFMR